MHQLTQNIQITNFTLADWLALSTQLDYKTTWAYGRWIDNAKPEAIAALGIGEWKKIAQAIGQSDSWAFYRYQEFNSEA